MPTQHKPVVSMSQSKSQEWIIKNMLAVKSSKDGFDHVDLMISVQGGQAVGQHIPDGKEEPLCVLGEPGEDLLIPLSLHLLPELPALAPRLPHPLHPSRGLQR